MNKDDDFAIHMNPEEFRSAGYAAIDWLVQHVLKSDVKPISPQVKPGGIRSQLPVKAPEKGESFESIMEDMNRIILPGLTKWQDPGFFGFFPANSSPPAILGDLLSTGLGVQGMLWSTGPAITELETHVLDWLIDMCGLPKQFHSSGTGGGVIQDSASSATLCAIVAAREKVGEGANLSEMCAYISDQAHSSSEKGLLIAGIKRHNIRKIATTNTFEISTKALQQAVQKDLADGLTPFFVLATLGTTSSGAFDNLIDINNLVQGQKIWVHVDAAWAGSAAICQEYRFFLEGLDRVDSYVFNPHKWLLTNFDCSAFYVADSKFLTKALSIVPEYLKNKASESGSVIDYRDWQIPLGRRFRSLKLWFVLRSYGAETLRKYIRQHIDLANWLEKQIESHPKVSLITARSLSLLCFNHIDGDEKSKKLLEDLNNTGKVLLTHTVLNNRYVIRVAIGGTYTQKKHVKLLMNLIDEFA